MCSGEVLVIICSKDCCGIDLITLITQCIYTKSSNVVLLGRSERCTNSLQNVREQVHTPVRYKPSPSLPRHSQLSFQYGWYDVLIQSSFRAGANVKYVVRVCHLERCFHTFSNLSLENKT